MKTEEEQDVTRLETGVLFLFILHPSSFILSKGSF